MTCWCYVVYVNLPLQQSNVIAMPLTLTRTRTRTLTLVTLSGICISDRVHTYAKASCLEQVSNTKLDCHLPLIVCLFNLFAICTTVYKCVSMTWYITCSGFKYCLTQYFSHNRFQCTSFLFYIHCIYQICHHTIPVQSRTIRYWVRYCR